MTIGVTPPPPHLHQLLFLLGERPRELGHRLQVALGARGFQGPQRQLLALNFEQVRGATHRHLMELRGGRGEISGGEGATQKHPRGIEVRRRAEVG